jgi:hypothetical protein
MSTVATTNKLQGLLITNNLNTFTTFLGCTILRLIQIKIKTVVFFQKETTYVHRQESLHIFFFYSFLLLIVCSLAIPHIVPSLDNFSVSTS